MTQPDNRIQYLKVESQSVTQPSSEDLLCTVSAETPSKGKGTISFNIFPTHIQVRRVNGQVEMEMAEDVAVRVAEAIIDMVGQISALRSMHMVAQAKRDEDEFKRPEV